MAGAELFEFGLAPEYLVGLTAFVFPLEQLAAIPLGGDVHLAFETTIMASILGNSAALYCAMALSRWCQDRAWFMRLQRGKLVRDVAARIGRHGVWLAPFFAPFVGTWVTSFACMVLGIERRRWVPFVQISIIVFAPLYGYLVYFILR